MSNELKDIKLAIQKELAEIRIIVRKINEELAQLKSHTDSSAALQSYTSKIKELQTLRCSLNKVEEVQRCDSKELGKRRKETTKTVNQQE